MRDPCSGTRALTKYRHRGRRMQPDPQLREVGMCRGLGRFLSSSRRHAARDRSWRRVDRADRRPGASASPRERSRAPVGPDDRLRVRGAVSDGRTRNYSTPGTLLVLCITERKARGRPPCFAPGTATQGADHLPDVAWPPRGLALEWRARRVGGSVSATNARISVTPRMTVRAPASVFEELGSYPVRPSGVARRIRRLSCRPRRRTRTR